MSEPIEATATRKRPKRSLPRRLARAGLILVVLFVLLRLALELALPGIINLVLSDFRLRAECESVTIRLLEGDLEFRQARIFPAEGGEALIGIGYGRCNLHVSALLGGELHFERITVEGADISLTRNADGEFDLIRRFTDPDPGSAEEDAQAEGILPPFRADAVLVTRSRVHFVDETPETGFVGDLEFSLGVRNFGDPGDPGDFEFVCGVDSAIGFVRVGGPLTFLEDRLDAEIDWRVADLEAASLLRYFRALGLRPTAEVYDLALTTRLALREAGPKGLVADLEVDNLRLWTDGREAAHLGELVATELSLGPDPISWKRIEVKRAFGSAVLPASGAAGICGFELLPGAATGTPSAGTAPASLGEVVLQDLRLSLLLADREPPLPLSLSIVTGTARPMESSGPGQAFDIRLNATAPGLVDSLTVAGAIGTDGPSCIAEVEARGFNPTLLAPRLRAAGIGPEFKSANLSFGVAAEVGSGPEGQVRASLEVLDIEWTPDGRPHSFERLKVAAVELDPAARRHRFGQVEIHGSSLSAERDQDGSVLVAGLRFSPSGPPAEESATPEATSLPRVEVGLLQFRFDRLAFDDHTLSPPLPIEARATSLTVRDFAAGGEDDPPHLDGEWELATSLTGLAERVSVVGRLNSRGRGSSFELAIKGTGLKGVLLERRLAASGLESRIDDAQLELRASGGVQQTEAGLTGDLLVEDLSLTDDGEELASLSRLSIRGIEVEAGRLHAKSLVISNPALRVVRDEQELLGALGLRLRPLLTGEAEEMPSTAAPAPPPALSLDQFELTNARLTWRDEAISPPCELTLVTTVKAGDLAYTGAELEGRFSVESSIADSTFRLSADGKYAIDRETHGLTVELALNASGVRPTAAAPYLPGAAVEVFTDGRLTCTATLEVADAEEGGTRGRLSVRNLDLHDEEDQRPAFRLPSMDIEARRIDLEHVVFDFEEVSLSGLRAELRRSTDGELLFLGRRISGPRTDPAGAAPTPGAPLTLTELRDALLARLEFEQPAVRVGRLDVGVAQLELRDDRRPDAHPFVLSEVRLTSRSEVVLFGPEPESNPPARLLLIGSIPALANELTVDIEVAPTAAEPWIGVDFEITGIRNLGEQLAVFPAELDLSRLVGGGLSGKLHATVKLRQTITREIDLSRGFAGHLVARDLKIVDASGEPLFELKELDAAIPLFHPAERRVRVSVLELIEPTLVLTRTTTGLEIAGIVVQTAPAGAPTPTPATDGAPAPTPATDGAPAPIPATDGAPAPTPSPRGPPPPLFNLAIDSIFVAGLDLTWSSPDLAPPIVLPLVGCDIEIQGFSTLALTEPLPIIFKLAGYSREVTLPLESVPVRDAFDEVAVRGHLTFFPVLTGWLQSTLRGVELSNFRGYGATKGFTLTDGLLDVATIVRFGEDGQTEISISNVFTDLDLSEPADGPIRKLLLLPTPLNTVIFVLQDSSGQIAVPLEFTMSSGQLSQSAVLREATTALAGAITSAIASSPLTLASFALSILDFARDQVGLGATDEPLLAEPPIVLPFTPGDAELSAEGIRKLREVEEKLRGDSSLTATIVAEFGEGDIAICRRRANLSDEDAMAYAVGLRRQRTELLRRREEARAEVRAAMAEGSTDRYEDAVATIREIDDGLAAVDASLAGILDALRPGADLRRDRRTNGAAGRLGAERLLEVGTQLEKLVSKDVAGRVQIRRSRYSAPVKEGGGRVVVNLRRKR